tara:strand:- start:1240 stop:3381 length:2142 start_codon:yes stop_codon:yes gene_type:complete
MANIIQLKRGTGSSVPSSLAEGELAINLDSGKLFYGSGSSVLSDFKVDTLTAETYVISSSVTHMTTSFSSGSTAFGDSAGDTHTFTGDITASGIISASGDIVGNGITSIDAISTSFTGSVDNPAIRLGPLSGNLAGNKVGLIMEDLSPPNKLFLPYFVANGNKIFGFGTLMDMQSHIQMNANKLTFDGDATNTYIAADTSTPENLEVHADGNIELRADDDLQVYSDVDVTGEITASGNISSSGNVYAADYFDNGANISSIYSPIAGGSGITTVGTLGSLTVTGNITANGNIVGDDGTNITNIAEVQCDSIASDAGSTTKIIMGAATIDVLVDDTDVFNVSPTLFTYDIPAKFSSHITSSGNISSSGNVYAADYFDNGTNINTIYSPIASPTFTGTVAIPNIANVETAITANTAKATNVSTNLTATTHASQITINSSDGNNVVIAEASDTIAGVMSVAHHDKLDAIEASADVTDATNVTAAGALMDSELTDLAGVKGVTISTLQVKPSEGAFANGDKTKLDAIEASATADQTQADINGLAITTVGALGSGTIASGFGNIDNGTSTLDTGEITATSIKHSISGNNAGDYGPGAEILYGISSETTTAGAIYTLRSGVWTLIDANTDNRVDRLCAVAVGTNSSTNGMLIRGCVTLASAFTAGTDVEGVQVYASETTGQATITAPSDSGDLVRILGYSLNVSAKKMFFNPDSTFLEIA